MSGSDIYNFVQIDERVGTAGQPKPEQFAGLRDEGYQVVINLAPYDHDFGGFEDEPAVVEGLGMTYHHLPVEWAKPTLADFNAFAAIMQSTADKKVLVHCAANMRVTAFYSLYAMKHENWSVAQADALVAEIWTRLPGYQMDETWTAFIRDVRADIAKA